MDQNKANDLISVYGFLVLLDCPAGLTLTLDFMQWQVGDVFQGIKLIPPGPHFCVVGFGENSPKPSHSFFFWVDEGEQDVVVKRWKKDDELFENFPEEDEQRLRDAVRRHEFDKKLGPYSQDDGGCLWKECTSFIDKDFLLRYLKSDLQRFKVCRGKSLDRSDELKQMRRKTNVLALLQCKYIEFTLTHEMESFEIWRDVVVLLCNSIEMIRSDPEFFVDFCDVASFQLTQAGEELLWQDGANRNNVFVFSFNQFLRDVESDEAVSIQLKKAIVPLNRAIPQLEDDEEDQPMIVELNY